jgi:hypothetical protein
MEKQVFSLELLILEKDVCRSLRLRSLEVPLQPYL